jgi:hypothetical protein
MVYLKTKSSNLVLFWGALEWKMMVYFTTIWYILQPIVVFYDYMVYFGVLWYILSRLGKFYPEKSGNPAAEQPRLTFEMDVLN